MYSMFDAFSDLNSIGISSRQTLNPWSIYEFVESRWDSETTAKRVGDFRNFLAAKMGEAIAMRLADSNGITVKEQWNLFRWIKNVAHESSTRRTRANLILSAISERI